MRTIEVEGKSVDEAVETALEELNVDRSDVKVEVLEEASSGFFGIGGNNAKVRVTVINDEIDETIDEISPNRVDLETTVTADESADLEDEDDDDDYSAEDYADEAEDTEEDEGLSKEDKYDVTKNPEFARRIKAAAQAIEDFLNKLLEHFDLEEANSVFVEAQEDRVVAKIDGSDCGILIGRRGQTLRAIQYITSLVANRTAKTRVRLSFDIGSYRSKRKNNVKDLALRTAKRAVETNQAFELTPMSASDRRIVHESLNDYPGVVTYSEGKEPHRYVVIDLEFDDTMDQDADVETDTEEE